MSKKPNPALKNNKMHFIVGKFFSKSQMMMSNSNKTTMTLLIQTSLQTKIRNNKLRKMCTQTTLKITMKKVNSSNFVFDSVLLRSWSHTLMRKTTARTRALKTTKSAVTTPAMLAKSSSTDTSWCKNWAGATFRQFGSLKISSTVTTLLLKSWKVHPIIFKPLMIKLKFSRKSPIKHMTPSGLSRFTITSQTKLLLTGMTHMCSTCWTPSCIKALMEITSVWCLKFWVLICWKCSKDTITRGYHSTWSRKSLDKSWWGSTS